MAHIRWSLVGSFDCALPRSATQWLRWQHDEHKAGVVAVLRSPAQCTLLAAHNLATFAGQTISRCWWHRSAACHQDALRNLRRCNSTLLAENSCIACFLLMCASRFCATAVRLSHRLHFICVSAVFTRTACPISQARGGGNLAIHMCSVILFIAS